MRTSAVGPVVRSSAIRHAAAVSFAFLPLAGGSFPYVVIELLHVNRAFGLKRIVTWGLLVGLVAGCWRTGRGPFIEARRDPRQVVDG